MGKSALVFSFSGKWGKSPLSCNFWRFEFDAGWGNAISSTHKLRGCRGHHVSGRYSVTLPQPRARGHFFHFLRPKCLNWGVWCNFNPRQGIPIISQAFGIRGATRSIIARRGIALDRKTLPTWGHFFHFLRPKWPNWGGFRSFCAISIQEGVFNSYVKQLACEGQCDTWLS